MNSLWLSGCVCVCVYLCDFVASSSAWNCDVCDDEDKAIYLLYWERGQSKVIVAVAVAVCLLPQLPGNRLYPPHHLPLSSVMDRRRKSPHAQLANIWGEHFGARHVCLICVPFLQWKNKHIQRALSPLHSSLSAVCLLLFLLAPLLSFSLCLSLIFDGSTNCTSLVFIFFSFLFVVGQFKCSELYLLLLSQLLLLLLPCCFFFFFFAFCLCLLFLFSYFFDMP